MAVFGLWVRFWHYLCGYFVWNFLSSPILNLTGWLCGQKPSASDSGISAKSYKCSELLKTGSSWVELSCGDQIGSGWMPSGKWTPWPSVIGLTLGLSGNQKYLFISGTYSLALSHLPWQLSADQLQCNKSVVPFLCTISPFPTSVSVPPLLSPSSVLSRTLGSGLLKQWVWLEILLSDSQYKLNCLFPPPLRT